MVNSFTYENRPYFGVKRNNQELIAPDKGRVLYSANNGQKIITNVTINPGETHNYEFTYEFKNMNNDQSFDIGKVFFGRLKVGTR